MNLQENRCKRDKADQLVCRVARRDQTLVNRMRTRPIPGPSFGPGGLNEIADDLKLLNFAIRRAQASLLNLQHPEGFWLGELEANSTLCCEYYTKFYLALLGQVSWKDIPTIPVELVLAPRWLPINLYSVSACTNAQIHGFGEARRAVEAKTLQTLLMMRASWEAQRAFAPEKRPFLISRSGAVGMHRYVQTWSGDNYTSWETLRYNIKMGVGLALSGISNIGHDVGGFSGPAPDAELLLRWVQFGIFMPRFSIHSWNDDKSVNEPWMYPEITPYICDLVKFRYRLIPYLYDLLWRSHRYYAPLVRPTFYNFPEDENCFLENDDMLLGENLLVAAVVEPGKRARSVYLPSPCGWYDFWTGESYHGGQEILLPAPWDRPPLLAREGCAIALNAAEQHFSKPADKRSFCIFPHRAKGEFTYECFEDDGESEGYRQGHYWIWRLKVTASPSELCVEIQREGEGYPKTGQVSLLFPRQETRRIDFLGGSVMVDASGATHREILAELARAPV